MPVAETALFAASVGCIASLTINAVAGLRIRTLKRELLENECAISFARLQSGWTGRIFLRLWQLGEMTSADPVLLDEWQQFRTDYLARAAESRDGEYLR